MISANSLAAFSASVTASLPSGRAGTVPGVVPVREQAAQAQAKPAVLTLKAAPPPGQKLPRGSLLDLRV